MAMRFGISDSPDFCCIVFCLGQNSVGMQDFFELVMGNLFRAFSVSGGGSGFLLRRGVGKEPGFL
jgi:uncharacterized membrane protein